MESLDFFVKTIALIIVVKTKIIEYYKNGTAAFPRYVWSCIVLLGDFILTKIPQEFNQVDK